LLFLFGRGGGATNSFYFSLPPPPVVSEKEEKEEDEKALEGLSKNWGKAPKHTRRNRHNKKNNAEEFGFYLTTRDHIARS
jgi:hypothetical protein